jgi:hypothetical protein
MQKVQNGKKIDDGEENAIAQATHTEKEKKDIESDKGYIHESFFEIGIEAKAAKNGGKENLRPCCTNNAESAEI